MKKLAVDIEEIAALMEMVDHEDERYLNLQTGAVVIIPPELLDRESNGDEDSSRLPDWEKDLLPIAEEINAGSDQYVPLPESDSSEAYDDMVRFARTVTDPELCKQLDIALDGQGAFRRFKNVLYDHPDEQQRWHAFKGAAMTERVHDWLGELGIEPVGATNK